MTPESSPTPAGPNASGGNRLLWVLLAIAGLFALLAPKHPAALLALVDWLTVGALAGLLAITQGVEQSGILQATARRMLARIGNLRRLAFSLTAAAAVLAALVTNDVSLFLLVPLTRVLATQAKLPLARLVVLEALAVNAGSALTPIGNPQNLFLWHQSGMGFGAFVWMMLPPVAIMLAWLMPAVWLLAPATPIACADSGGNGMCGGQADHGASGVGAAPVEASAPELRPRLLTLSVALFCGFVLALDRHWLVPGLAVVGLAYLLLYPRVLRSVDFALLATIALMFIDLRQLAALPWVAHQLAAAPVAQGWRAYLAAVGVSQLISNVPAAIMLAPHVHDLPALAAGVSVGGFGCVLGSLANLIALRLAKLPNALWQFHRISVPFLLACAASVALLHLG